MKAKNIIKFSDNKNIVLYGSMLLLGAVALIISPEIFAQASTESVGIAKVTKQLSSQLPGVADVLGIGAYLGGIYFGIRAVLKMKESNENKGQTPMSQAAINAAGSGLLLALPTLMTTSSETTLGSSTTKTDLEGWNSAD